MSGPVQHACEYMTLRLSVCERERDLCWTDTQAMLQVDLSEALSTVTHPVADNVDDDWTFVKRLYIPCYR